MPQLFDSPRLFVLHNEMESENGVTVEEENRVIEVTSKENLNKQEDHKDCNGIENQTHNEVSKPIVEAEAPKSAGTGVAIEAPVTSSASKTLKSAKVPYMIYQIFVHIYCCKVYLEFQHMIHDGRIFTNSNWYFLRKPLLLQRTINLPTINRIQKAQHRCLKNRGQPFLRAFLSQPKQLVELV